MHPRARRLFSWTLALSVAANACSPSSGDELSTVITAGMDSPSVSGARPAADSTAAEEGVRDQIARSAAVDESRYTAIVRASERVAPAVVHVSTVSAAPRARTAWQSFFYSPRPQTGFGSGIVIEPSGVVLTNDHVIRGAERILVTLPDGRDFEAAVVGTDQITDVAVLKVDGTDLPTAPLGTTKGLAIGEWAIAIGNPFGYLFSDAEPTVTAGVISAIGRHLIPSSEERGFYLGMVQTDASINPGNSGGPLVNALGEVIGINSSIFSRSGGSEGLGFAIPIDRALRIADDLIEYGEVRRAWLGFEVEALEADVFGRTRGVTVTRVVGGSPAAEAGIRAGDRLLQANGRGLATPLDFEAVLLDLRPGDSVEVLAEEDRNPVSMTAENVPSLRAERVRVFEDLELVSLTPAIQQEQGVVNDQGALIVSISSDLSRQLDLRAGDVLLQINSIRISSADDAAAALRSIRRQVRIYFERNGGLNVRDFAVR